MNGAALDEAGRLPGRTENGNFFQFDVVFIIESRQDRVEDIRLAAATLPQEELQPANTVARVCFGNILLDYRANNAVMRMPLLANL